MKCDTSRHNPIRDAGTRGAAQLDRTLEGQNRPKTPPPWQSTRNHIPQSPWRRLESWRVLLPCRCCARSLHRRASWFAANNSVMSSFIRIPFMGRFAVSHFRRNESSEPLRSSEEGRIEEDPSSFHNQVNLSRVGIHLLRLLLWFIIIVYCTNIHYNDQSHSNKRQGIRLTVSAIYLVIVSPGTSVNIETRNETIAFDLLVPICISFFLSQSPSHNFQQSKTGIRRVDIARVIDCSALHS